MVARKEFLLFSMILHEQVSRVNQQGRATRANADITMEIQRMLRAHADELDASLDPAVAATVFGTVMDAIAHKALLGGSASLAGKTAADEGYALVMSYLTRPVRPSCSDGIDSRGGF